MLEITADNAIAYLHERGLPGDRAEVLPGGVSNQVLRIDSCVGPLVLKQARAQLRTREAWFSDLERIHREHEVMQALEPLLPATAVPRVVYVDRANYLYLMTHAPGEARVWKAELLDGRIDLQLGESVGRTLGLIHQASACEPDRFAAFRDQAVFVQLRVEPFYRRVQERRPEVATAVDRLVVEMLTRHDALCHGDYTPKNILAHAQGFTLVDYETAHVGDPTMDLGLFLAHIVLKAVRRPNWRGQYFALARRFWAGYAAAAEFCMPAELEERGLRHLGVCLLARVDGTSPVDYLPDESDRETVRCLGRALLHGELTRWEEVWRWADEAPAHAAVEESHGDK